MKLKNKYGNIVKYAENEREIERLKGMGYTEVEEKEIPLDDMTVPQLEAYAKERNIDLSGCKNKTEKLAKIKEFIEE